MVELPLEEWVPSIYWAGLNCTKNAHDQLGIWLLVGEQQKDCYTRISLCLMGLDNDMSLWLRGVRLPRKQMPSRQYLLPRQARFLRCRQMTINIASTDSRSRPSHYLFRNPPPPVAGIFLSTMQVPPAHKYRTVVGTSFSHPVDYEAFQWSGDRVDWEASGLDVKTFSILRGPRQEGAGGRGLLIQTDDTSPCHPSSGLMCIVTMPSSSTDLCAIKLGFDRDFHPICIISETSHPTLQSRFALPSALFKVSDCSSSNNLAVENFWQCNGPEDLGWRNPSSQVLLHEKYTQRGLWAHRADRSGTSNFMLRTSGFRSNC